MAKYVVEVRTSEIVRYLVEADEPPKNLDDLEERKFMHNSAEYEKDFKIDSIENVKEWEPDKDGCDCYGWSHDTKCPNWVMVL